MICYAADLEQLVLEAARLLGRGDIKGFEVIEEAAAMAAERDLTGEMDAAEAWDAARRAGEARAAGRLH